MARDTSNEALTAETLSEIPRFAQAQYELDKQLRMLHDAANRLGFYDAADYIKRRL